MVLLSFFVIIICFITPFVISTDVISKNLKTSIFLTIGIDKHHLSSWNVLKESLSSNFYVFLKNFTIRLLLVDIVLGMLIVTTNSEGTATRVFQVFLTYACLVISREANFLVKLVLTVRKTALSIVMILTF